jgi:acetyltransferase-like isoleucine patch superfamily enzyme
MWSNQYVKERFWALSANEKQSIGTKYRQANSKKEQWLRDFYENRDFFIKYGNVKYEKSLLREKRNKAYSERYNAGRNLLVEYDVNISRQHYLDGTISIGDDVLLAKHVFIDYSGCVVIKNGVQLANGVILETHHHAFHSDPAVPRSVIIPSELTIEEGVVLGSRVIVLPTCHYIGKFSRIGAGAVVTKDIPDYSVAVGVPAKVIRSFNHES